jgi:hypothetical protein
MFLVSASKIEIMIVDNCALFAIVLVENFSDGLDKVPHVTTS